MNNIKIIHANKNHKKFLIYANKVIDNVNNMEETNGLELNIDKDYFCDNPKFQCLVAEFDNKPVGMILYSYFYWASDGQVLWISQMFIEPKYRKYGIFFKLISKLREENKASAYVKIRVVTILVNLFFCIVFYSVIPGIRDLQNIFPAEYGAGYYLISNLIASVTAAFMLIPAVRGIRPRIKRKLLQPLFIYSLPLLISGVTGPANEFIDRQFIKYLLPQESAMSTLGIYGAALKLGGILLLFVQMFRLAAEPFFLAAFKKEDFLKANAETLKYFLIVSMLLFLVISLFSDFFGLILGSDFRDGLFIIPVVLFANIGNGIVFNLSFWYKRTGKTRLAILVTGSGLICTIVFNLLLLPRLGYAGTAWAHLGSEWIMVIVSYILSRIYYPVPYPLKRILFYLSGGILFYFLGAWQKDISWTGNILFNLSLIVIYTGVVVKVEKINISRHPF